MTAPKTTVPQYRMLVSVSNHGDPFWHLIGLAEHGGGAQTLGSLLRRGLVVADPVTGGYSLTPEGQAALAP